MSNIDKDFRLYAKSNGVNSMLLDDYRKSFGYVNPTILEERQLNVIGLDIFSRLMLERIIFLGSEINDDVSNIVASQLMYLNSIDQNTDVKLFINSPGGSVTSGLAIYDVMNFITPDVSTYCMGMAASMGAVLLSSGTKGKRFSLPHGDIMIHQPMGGVAPHSQESDFAIAYEQIKKCKDELYSILSENTGKSVEQITIDADRDHWLTAKEAQEYGIIDEIISKKR